MLIILGFKMLLRRSGEDEKRDRGSVSKSLEWVNRG